MIIITINIVLIMIIILIIIGLFSIYILNILHYDEKIIVSHG